MIINVYAAASAKNFEEFGKFMQMPKRVMPEGRREGARRFFVAGDLMLELGLLCMMDNDDLKEVYVEADPGGLKTAMCQERLTEFNCKALSYLVELFDDPREQLEYIWGPRSSGGK